MFTKKHHIKNVIAAIVCCLTMTIAIGNGIANPINAEAFHWDFWNSYEDDCAVAYQEVSVGIYKVVVVSADCHRVWRNDVSQVMFWYPKSYLEAMIGYQPGYSGSTVCDIRVEVLNNPTYFAAYIG